jgi:3-isopropylmalate/(R)-2-methylmalate dehydratase small subunit
MDFPNLKGRVAWIFDETDFDVDRIIGVANIKIKDPLELAKLAMVDFDPTFREEVKPGDLLVGNLNFGYGHPHYPAMIAMRQLGITGVVSEGFSPGYFGGEISMGFPQVEAPGVLGFVNRWDELEVDWTLSELINHTQGTRMAFPPLAEADMKMLAMGGLKPFIHAQADKVKSTGEV